MHQLTTTAQFPEEPDLLDKALSIINRIRAGFMPLQDDSEISTFELRVISTVIQDDDGVEYAITLENVIVQEPKAMRLRFGPKISSYNVELLGQPFYLEEAPVRKTLRGAGQSEIIHGQLYFVDDEARYLGSVPVAIVAPARSQVQ